MLPKGYAFVSNIGMMLYITCWMAQYCYQAQSYTTADLNGMDHLKTWVILNIAGACCIQLGLLVSMAKIAIDQAALGYGASGLTAVGWIIITVGMGYGSDTPTFKNVDFDFNISVAFWFAVTGICFQCMLNGIEHAIEEDDSGEPTKKVDI